MAKTLPFSLVALLIACLASCSKPSSADQQTDTTIVASDSVRPEDLVGAEDIVLKPAAEVHNLQGADTLFNILARKRVVRGELVGVTVLTENFLDVDHLDKPRDLVAVLIQTGEGEYSGMREMPFETIFSWLAVFDLQDEDMMLVDYIDLGESTSRGLVLNDTEGGELKLTTDRSAAIVHFLSSEEGAGDAGYHTDDFAIYLLLSGKIAKVLEGNIEDSGFTSNETDAYAQRSATTELKVLDQTTLSLHDVRLLTTTTTSSTDVQNTEDDENPSVTYKWNGKVYEQVSDEGT